MRKHAIISNVANVNIFSVLATLGSSVVGCFDSILVRTIARRSCCLLPSTKRINPIRTCSTRRGVEIE